MSDESDFDRRLRGIQESLELSSRNIHEMQENLAETRRKQEEYERQQRALDRRERRGREAILAGIARYFQIMNEPESPSE